MARQPPLPGRPLSAHPSPGGVGAGPRAPCAQCQVPSSDRAGGAPRLQGLPCPVCRAPGGAAVCTWPSFLARHSPALGAALSGSHPCTGPIGVSASCFCQNPPARNLALSAPPKAPPRHPRPRAPLQDPRRPTTSPATPFFWHLPYTYPHSRSTHPSVGSWVLCGCHCRLPHPPPL